MTWKYYSEDNKTKKRMTVPSSANIKHSIKCKVTKNKSNLPLFNGSEKIYYLRFTEQTPWEQSHTHQSELTIRMTDMKEKEPIKI